jgi:hypothetical protein
VRRGYIAAVFISGPYFRPHIPLLQVRLRTAYSCSSHSACDVAVSQPKLIPLTNVNSRPRGDYSQIS